MRLPKEEVVRGERDGSVGPRTRSAIRQFLGEYDLTLPPTVEEDTAEWFRWLSRELEAAAADRHVIYGNIAGAGKLASSITVKAFDRDLPSLRRDNVLGETRAGGDGQYSIAFRREDFIRDEGKGRNIYAQALNPAGLVLGRSDPVLFNVSEREIRIDLDVSDRRQRSEYENYRDAMVVLAQSVPLMDLTREDVEFLSRELELSQKQDQLRRRIDWIRAAGALERMSGVESEAFYGWASALLPPTWETLWEAQEGEPRRQALEAILRQLVETPDGDLRSTLARMVDERIISAAFRDRINDAVRRLKRGHQKSRTTVLRLLDEATGERVANAAVQVVDLETEPSPPIGSGMTDARGELSITYFADADKPPHRLQVSVTSLGASDAVVVDIAPDPSEAVTKVMLPAPPAWVAADVAIPESLIEFLRNNGLGTLGAIRRRGGLANLAGLPVEATPEMISLLEAHANLSLLAEDVGARRAAIACGFTDVPLVAAASRAEFVAKVGDQIGDFSALRLHTAANAEMAFAENIFAGALADPVAPTGVEVERPIGAASTCQCEECTSALSPLAYLADLLRYAVDHLRKDSQPPEPVDSQYLETNFHQPFGPLPVSCDSADRRIRQVRLVIESLRSHLRSSPPAAAEQAALSLAEVRYRLAAYQSLLLRLGSSYEEIRRARTSTAADRKALAERLGIVLTESPGVGGDEIAQLLLDPSPGATEAVQISETNLELLFGLADTRRDPLSHSAKVNDPAGQIQRWTLKSVTWGRNTSPDGSIFVWLSAEPTGGVVVDLFADRERTRRVATAMMPAPNATIALVPEAGSGLHGTVTVTYATDTPAETPIELIAIPRVVSWRLAALRSRWRELDGVERVDIAPIIDPDTVPAAYLADPTRGAAATLWQKRSADLAAQAAHVDGIRLADPARSPLATLDAMIQDTFGTSGAALAELAEKRRKGQNVYQDLQSLKLSGSALEFIVRMRDVGTNNQLLLDAEWQAIVNILVQSWKEKSYQAWRLEEKTAGITLSTDHFQLLPETSGMAPLQLPEWRANILSLHDWAEVLRGRIHEEAAILASVAEAVSEVEEAELPALRDALVIASNAVGSNLDAKAGWMSDRLFVDVKAGGCQLTTRAAHAIEALQSMLSAARADRFEAAPKLVLDAPAFDQEWKCIGSYATWRGYMFVFLYPENVLLPGLLEPKSPGIETLLARLTSSKLTVKAARDVAAEYARYFEDVCKLALGASCAAWARVINQPGYANSDAGYRCLLFLFGATPRGTLYWSISDPENPQYFRQRFWTPIPTGDGLITGLIGATPYQLPNGQRYVYLFFKRRVGSREELAFARMDLETYRWELMGPLALPDNATEFSAIMVVRSTESYYPAGIPKAWNHSVSPQLLIRGRDAYGSSNGWFEAQLTEQGDGWSDGFGKVAIPATAEVKAALDQGNNSFYIVFQDGPYLRTQLALCATSPPRATINGTRFYTISSYYELGHLINHTYCGALVFPTQDYQWMTFELYLFVRTPAGVLQALLFKRDPAYPNPEVFVKPIGSNLPPTIRICTASGSLASDKLGFKNWFGFTLEDQPGRAFFGRVFRDGPGGALTHDLSLSAKPGIVGPFDIAAPLSSASLQLRRKMIDSAYAAPINNGGGIAQLEYLKEAYFLVPIAIALELQRCGEYQAALDWFRLAYDFNAPKADRKISSLLRLEEQLSGLAEHAPDWLVDPLSPHRIAETRRNCYTRFTITSIARCLGEMADAEFARDTAESLPRARWAYETLLELLNAPEFAQRPKRCEELINHLGEGAPKDALAQAGVKLLRNESASIADPVALAQAVELANGALAGGNDQSWTDRLSVARVAIGEARAFVGPRLRDWVTERRSVAVSMKASIARIPEVDAALLRVGEAASSEVGRAMSVLTGTPVAILATRRTKLDWLRHFGVESARMLGVRAEGGIEPAKVVELATAARSIPGQAWKILDATGSGYVPGAPVSFCVPQNPVAEMLRMHAQLNLHKLRSCRNIAGLRRQVDAYAAPTDVTSGMPLANGDGIFVAAVPTLRPTQYRYSALIERAKQLIQIATQIEASFLQSLEKRDDNAYTVLRARQELNLAQSEVQFHVLRIAESVEEEKLAKLQRIRAEKQRDGYQKWIDEGLNQAEAALLENYKNLHQFEDQIAYAEYEIQKYSYNPWMRAGGNPVSAILGLGTVGFLNKIRNRLGTIQQAERSKNLIEYYINVNSLSASCERRRQEWELGKLLAEQDVEIGNQQVTIAAAHRATISQEKAMAELKGRNASDVIEFLTNKFTNVRLYEWMVDVLQGVYRFFLQQATAMARLAECQLAFERQEMTAGFIQSDYWDPMDKAAPSGTAPVDRRGLTGSARLLQDLYNLDQYAFETRKRKLQLTKTISLASLAPIEFQRFRETGVITFATPMELFDRDYPGHYLRLISKVSVTVIALVPPSHGVRATLSSSGISRVVTGSEIFRIATIRRDPEVVALSSPLNATGLFELNPEPDVLAPFEGLGVDTTWELRMPKAANAIDYRTIADVLISIDYTALDSLDYRQQVIKSLNPNLSADRAFSFRNQFADQWYDLHNPEQTSTPMLVHFRTVREDFPANVDALKIQHVLLCFMCANATSIEVPVIQLRYTAQEEPGTVGGSATPIDGIISTRRGNAGSWMAVIGKSPVGEWELALPDTGEIKARFKNEEIEDILFIITYSARTPEWPG